MKLNLVQFGHSSFLISPVRASHFSEHTINTFFTSLHLLIMQLSAKLVHFVASPAAARQLRSALASFAAETVAQVSSPAAGLGDLQEAALPLQSALQGRVRMQTRRSEVVVLSCLPAPS